MKRLQHFLQEVSAWQVRIVALAFIVLGIAGGFHMLVNAFAATTETSIQTNYVLTNYVSIPMHVVHPPYVIFHVPSKGYQPISTSNR